ncbi:PAS domain S-box protein [Segetibacter sp. 3557_3]|uniref:PAS domain-containing sensor histidine kinase n=1 Tax=Segetibacter sp. 3557_3 TaxID=2547429 RepID=UPI001058B4BD|nr:PAS domain-containing protein [Segetibacter sp. 3557_3]TDH18417.1 PAS domain S-box protein [Segetibacter sp. 3557_3]
MDFRAYEAAPGISVIVLADAPVYTHVAVSNDFLRLWKMNKADVIGKGHFAIFGHTVADPEYTGEQFLRASFSQVIRQAVPHEIPIQSYRIPNGDGTSTQRFWKITNVPLFDERGEVAYIIHSSVDITNEITAVRAVQTSKGFEKAYHFFMNAPVIIGYVRGVNYIIELANEGLLEVWGKTSEVIGKPLVEAIPELKEQGFTALLDKVRTTGEPFYAYEYPITLERNGKPEVLYFDFVYKPFYESDQDNKATGVISVGHNVTEQVELRQKFKSVVQQVQHPILIFKGKDMVLEVANDALFKLWKVDESAIGKTFLEILPEMKGQGFPELLMNVFYTGEVFQGYETPALFEEEGGTTRTVYFNFTYQPYREHDGRITGVLVLATDVTDQVMAKREVEKGQAALKQSKERFDLVTKATQDAVWDWDLTRNEATWNESITTLFGYTPNEVLQTPDWWYAQLHTDDRDRVVSDLNRLLAGGSSGGNAWSAEYRFLCADGTYKTVYHRGFVQHDDTGKAIRMIGSMQDITARKQYELSIKESEYKWQQLANAVPAFVWTAAADGRIDFLNQLWYSYTGYTKEQSMDFGWSTTLHPDDVDNCLRIWNEARSAQVFYEVDVRYRSRDGNYRWFVARGVPIKNDGSEVVAWYGTSTDIHEQKLLSENLEKLVTERTAALKRSNDSLKEFAYVASHDMKEPIRKINYFSDKLKTQLADKMEAEDFRLFERMQQASRRMANLIDDLLAYSEASQGTAEMDNIDLNSKLKLVLEDLELEVQEKGATIKVNHLPVIKGNRRQFQQLFQNLVSNAIKYSKEEESPEIHIFSEVVNGGDFSTRFPAIAADRQYHLIVVKDSGIGFAQEDAERIFNVFTRLHGHSAYRGTGVGLSIVRKVVENHNGYIWAESSPGEGSTFKMLLPAVESMK